MLKTCQTCKSGSVVALGSHGKDLQYIDAPHLNFNIESNYLPHIPNLCSSDDINIEVCFECGQLQGMWPADISDISDIQEDIDDDFNDDVDISDAELDQRQLEFLSTLPDSEEEIALSKRFFDKKVLLSPDTINAEDAFIRELKMWMVKYGDCCRYNENASDWGSLVFNNAVNAAKFANHFDLAWYRKSS